MRLVRITDDLYSENCYIVIQGVDAYVIDPGFSYEKIISFIKENNYNLKMIFLTHGHIDHIGDIDKLNDIYNDIPIYISEEDSNFLFDAELNVSTLMGKSKTYSTSLNINIIDFDKEVDGFKFYRSPGHTKGSILIKLGDFLFTGDTLFNNSIGRTDFPTGSYIDLNNSLKFIKKHFSKKTTILPGHMNKSTLKDEIKNNTYMR